MSLKAITKIRCKADVIQFPPTIKRINAVTTPHIFANNLLVSLQGLTRNILKMFANEVLTMLGHYADPLYSSCSQKASLKENGIRKMTNGNLSRGQCLCVSASEDFAPAKRRRVRAGHVSARPNRKDGDFTIPEITRENSSSRSYRNFMCTSRR